MNIQMVKNYLQNNFNTCNLIQTNKD